MQGHNQLKTAGIRYARSLQMVFKTVAMFSADHTAAAAPLKTSFDMLNELVKQTRQFTIGFVDQRVMLNNILTQERSLHALENEFLKRGIGAVTFDAGLTLAGYKRAMAMLTRPAKVIEEAGGLLPYLEQNRVDFVRVFPASKNQQRTESGDTILDTDSESFLMAKAFSDLRTPGLEKMEWLLQSSGGGPGGGPGPGGGGEPGSGGGGFGGGGGGEGFGGGGGGEGFGAGGGGMSAASGATGPGLGEGGPGWGGGGPGGGGGAGGPGGPGGADFGGGGVGGPGGGGGGVGGPGGGGGGVGGPGGGGGGVGGPGGPGGGGGGGPAGPGFGGGGAGGPGFGGGTGGGGTGGGGAGGGGTGGPGGGGTGWGPGVGGGGGGPGGGPGFGGGGPGAGGGPWRGGRGAPMQPMVMGPGGPDSITRMVEGYFESSLLDGKEEQKSYVELARVIREMRPEFVLASFSPTRREELRAMPPEQMASEIIEDTAAKWAADRLSKVPSGHEATIVEDEVVRVLLRSLQATQTAERLARKLGQFIQDLQVPQSTYQRIDEELKWVALPTKEKTARLKSISHFTAAQFRWFIGHLKDLTKQGELEAASDLANHYMSVLDEAPVDPEPQEISRIPELLRSISGVRTDFWANSTNRLGAALERWQKRQFLHLQVANAMLTLSKTISLYEEFSLVTVLGSALEKLVASDPAAHTECCGKVLQQLVTQNAIERILEIYLNKRDDLAFARTSATLLKWSGAAALDKVFRQLEDEPVAGNRLALIRLIGRIGPAALEVARGRLNDGRWYVVRNACKLLGDLKDPDIVEHLKPALQHSNERVQKAAAVALMDSRDPRRAQAFAEALPHLHHQVQEEVLGELLFMKDPTTLPALEDFLTSAAANKSRLALQAAQAICAMGGDESEKALGRIFLNRDVGVPVRRITMTALVHRSAASVQLLRDFIQGSPDDPLAVECTKALAVAYPPAPAPEPKPEPTPESKPEPTPE